MNSLTQSLFKKYPEIAKKLDELIYLFKVALDLPMTFNETRCFLHYSDSHLYKLVFYNRIPFHKPSGKILFFYRSELDEWIGKYPKFRNRI